MAMPKAPAWARASINKLSDQMLAEDLRDHPASTRMVIFAHHLNTINEEVEILCSIREIYWTRFI